MIEWYIKQLLEQHIKSHSDQPITILLKAIDEGVIGKVILADNNFSFWGYEHSKNTEDVKWEVNKKRIDLEEFNKVCGSTHKCEIK